MSGSKVISIHRDPNLPPANDPADEVVPQAETIQRGDLRAAAARQNQAPLRSDRERMKILLVDDAPDNLVSLEAALESLGEELITVRSGREALRQLLDHDFAAILLDVKMPDMDGFETAELIRARKRSAQTPILFLTGYRNEEHLFRGYDLGAVDFLFKPIVPEILRSKVAVFVELTRANIALRRQAEGLAKAEQKFRSLLEAAPDAMLMTRPDGSIVMANGRSDSLFGYSRQEILNHNIRDLVPSWLPTEVTAAAECDARRLSGETFPAAITCSPVLTEEGILITTAVRDISVSRRAERDLEERTRQLLLLNRELEAFSYSVSHDLRAPLRSIDGFSRILMRDYAGEMLDEKGIEYLERLCAASSRMGALIEDLLELSRVSRFDLISRPVDLTQLAAEIVHELRLKEPNRQIEVAIQPGMIAQGDHRLLRLALTNLLSNSWKFTGKTPSPRIEFCEVPERGTMAYVVRDNGAGFDPAFAENLFAPFHRLHAASEYEGTGVGLAIVQRVIHRHNGRIWSTAAVGRGASFYFTLFSDGAAGDLSQPNDSAGG